MDRMCEEETLWREMKKIEVRFFLTPGIRMRFHAKKMREYRKIAPENDPCKYTDFYDQQKYWGGRRRPCSDVHVFTF